MLPATPLKRIAPAELSKLLGTSGRPLLIDLLPSDHHRRVRLPGAANACVFEVSFLEQVARIVTDTEAEIVLYGSSAQTLDAQTAADKLHRAGYRNITMLEGGLAGWRAAGWPLEGEAPEQPDDPGTSPILPEGRYTVDGALSRIEWAGRNPNTRHHGTVDIRRGTLAIRSGALTGDFDIDMRTIRNINLEGDDLQPVLEAHLRSDDFFFVERFPSARFVIRQATPVETPTASAPNYTVDGSLELTGVHAGVQFMATVNRLPEGGLAAEAHFDIDRTRWKVRYGSSRFFEHLGMHMVFDPISLQIKIVAR
jgi:polyisoprenoid-binding protein YceI/rhodanese-related sulfurtransferase